MALHTQFGSDSFALVAKGLVAVHAMIRAGTDESPEAESIRDSLEAPNKNLTPTEKHRAQWLSEDLYSISDPADASTPQELTPEARQQLLDALEARENRDWDRALLLLRQLQKSLPPALVSHLRGSIWTESGHPEVAVEFYRHAAKCDPGDANYWANYLTTEEVADLTRLWTLVRN